MAIERNMILRRLAVGGLCVAAAWVVHSQSVIPLQESEQAASRKIQELHERIENADKKITGFVALEQQAARATAELTQLKRDLPVGPHAVWFPELMEKHFPSFGIPVAITRLGAIVDEPDLPDYQRVHWAVGLKIASGNRNVPDLLTAVAEIDA